MCINLIFAKIVFLYKFTEVQSSLNVRQYEIYSSGRLLEQHGITSW